MDTNIGIGTGSDKRQVSTYGPLKKRQRLPRIQRCTQVPAPLQVENIQTLEQVAVDLFTKLLAKEIIHSFEITTSAISLSCKIFLSEKVHLYVIIMFYPQEKFEPSSRIYVENKNSMIHIISVENGRYIREVVSRIKSVILSRKRGMDGEKELYEILEREIVPMHPFYGIDIATDEENMMQHADYFLHFLTESGTISRIPIDGKIHKTAQQLGREQHGSFRPTVNLARVKKYLKKGEDGRKRLYDAIVVIASEYVKNKKERNVELLHF